MANKDEVHVEMGGIDDDEIKVSEPANDSPRAPVAVKDMGPQEVKLPPSKGPLFLQWPLFWFPYQVNSFATQMVALQVVTVIVCLLIYRHVEADHTWTPYITLLICIDYLLRFFFGGNASFKGANGAVLAKVFDKRKMIPGAQKQFAAFCGAFMSGIATIGYFEEDDGVVGSLFLGMLLVAASLEAFLDFCLGCYIYGFFRGSPFLSGLIRKIYGWEQDLSEEYQRTVDYQWKVDLQDRAGRTRPEAKVITREYQGDEASVYLHYKVKTDNDRRLWSEYIPFCHVSYFSMPLSLSAVAAALWVQRADAGYINLNIPRSYWKGVAYYAAVVFTLLFVLYFCKAVLYFKKFLKEWNHPVKRNFFSAITISLMILVWLMRSNDIEQARANGTEEDQDKVNFTQFVWWICAALQVFFGLSITARWIKEPQQVDLVEPSWMMPALGNLVAALTIRVCAGEEYKEDGWFFFGFGIYFWIVLSSVVLYRLMFKAPLPAGAVHGMLIFVAAPAIASAAYTTLAAYDNFAKTLFWISCVMILVFFYLGLLNGFGRDQWNMTWWAYVFAFASITIAGTSNHALTDTNRSMNILYISLSLASGVSLIFTSLTVKAIAMNTAFVPLEKWGPLSFMKMVHYSFREAARKITVVNKRLEAAVIQGTPVSDEELTEFTKLFDDLAVVHSAHSVHEDKVVFRAYHQWFPDHPTPSNEEHERDHHLLEQMEGIVAKLQAAPRNDKNLRLQLLGEIVPRLQAFLHTLGHHLDGEELHLNPIGQKYINIEWQKELVRKCWDITPVEDWMRILPFVVKNQFLHKRRVQFLQGLRWAIPEKTQLIGRLLRNGIDDLTWHRVIADVPELVPRNETGYTRIY